MLGERKLDRIYRAATRLFRALCAQATAGKLNLKPCLPNLIRLCMEFVIASIHVGPGNSLNGDRAS